MAELLKNIQSYWDMRAGGFQMPVWKKENRTWREMGKYFQKFS